MGAAIALALVAACSSGHPALLAATPTTPPPANIYRGPLSGPAGRALECSHRPFAHGSQDYADGLAAVAGDYLAAARDFLGGDDYVGATVPSHGYRIERRSASRVLLSWDVAGRTKVAMIVHDGITDYLHHRGWGVETWAQCDPAEFPPATTEALGISIWQDRTGARVPVAAVHSVPGQQVCHFGGTGSLQVGKQSYVHDPNATMSRYLLMPYDGSAALPSDARDSGWHHYGRELWFASNHAAVYLVSLASSSDVQRWPALDRGFGCD